MLGKRGFWRELFREGWTIGALSAEGNSSFVCRFGNFARGTGGTLGLTVRDTRRVHRGCINARRVLCKLMGRNDNITTATLGRYKMARSTLHRGLRSVGNAVSLIRLAPSSFAPHAGEILETTIVVSSGANCACMNARRLLLTVLSRDSDCTITFLRRLNMSIRELTRTISGNVRNNTSRNFNNFRGRSTPGNSRGNNSTLSGFNESLARTTGGNRVSPMVNERGRVREIVRVLSHHAGGGPILVNRPNMNGATITRKLTLRVTGNGIPRVLGSGQIIDLSLANVMTNTGCENSFRREVGTTVSRIGGSGGAVLFVSRLRAVINTNTTRNDTSTTGVLGPSLTENSFRIVNTAALGRCEGCVRGSTTLRHHFRPMGINRPAPRRTMRVLGNLHSDCRTRRGIGVASRTVGTTMALSSECVTSHCLPSGTVSLVSRNTSGMELTSLASPSGMGRLRSRVTSCRGRGTDTVGRRSFRETTQLHSRRGRLRAGLSSTGGG